MTPTTSSTRWRHLERIEISDLFGRYSYDLRRLDGSAQDRVMILYGDNGSGKTTILKLLYHLLSSAQARGHFTKVADIPFGRFAITFSDGISLEAKKKQNRTLGPFTLTLRQKNSDVQLTAEVDPKQIQKSANSPITRIYNRLRSDGLDVYLLTETRDFLSDVFELNESHRYDFMDAPFPFAYDSHELPRSRKHIDVTNAIGRAELWIRRHALEATERGDSDVLKVYTDLINTIAHGPMPFDFDMRREASIESVSIRLHALAKRHESFERFGLAPAFTEQRWLAALSHAPPDRTRVAAETIASYIRTLDARLDALESTRRRLAALEEFINGMYMNKQVRIRVQDGIEVLDDSGHPLDLRQLSSGEQQVLTMLCSVLCATDSHSIFLIDEPEISLNIKWKRKLVDGLLDLSADAQVDFVLSTHSHELLSPHRGAVATLEPK